MKKKLLLTLAVAGVVWLATAAEPTAPATSPNDTATAMSATKSSAAGLDAADKAYDAQIGQRLAKSGSLTTKPRLSLTKKFLQSVNPLAPMKPVPNTPWISRASWNEIAITEHERNSPVSMASGATNRELKIKFTVWRD